MTGHRGFPALAQSLVAVGMASCGHAHAFASLAAVRLLPGGYVRAALAAPILLVVPGSLTLGAVFGRAVRPQGAVFVCYAALLGAVWSAFRLAGSLRGGVLITADSTYWCLLIVSACAGRNRGRGAASARAAGNGPPGCSQARDRNPDQSDAEANDAESVSSGAGERAIMASSRSRPGSAFSLAGCTPTTTFLIRLPLATRWMAWTGPPIKGGIAIGSAGTKLDFQIVHHQSDTTTFRLSAAWLGHPSRPLAKPLALSIGPNRTFQGALVVPPLPDGCTYRIVVTLTAARQIDPLT